MDAVVVRRGESTPTVVDRPRPDPAPGEALIRTLRVGVDGTDHEVLAGGPARFPEGDDHLVLGHEAVGVVADPNGTDLSAGDVVAPTVRRPPPGGTNEYFAREEPDMAPPEACVERGIDGAHGFMAEYVTTPDKFLVPVPESLALVGFLLEPLSVTEKALEHAYASREAFDWSPESALVLGNGSLGILTLATLDGYDRTYCLGRRDRSDPTVALVERLDATYVDSREMPVAEFAEAHEPVDLAYEATGHPPHAVEVVHTLAPGGVGALLGVPDSATFEVDGGVFHRALVMGNRSLVGSVNSNVGHFRAATDALAGLDEGFLDDFLTDIVRPENAPRAFADDETTIKTAVEFHTP